MEVLVKKLNENAVIPFKKHDSDFCYDLTATSCERLDEMTYKYGTGLSLEAYWDKLIGITVTEWDCHYDANDEPMYYHGTIEPNISFDIRPRSSIYKTGMVLANSTATVDEDYRGEIFLIFYHLNKEKMPYQVGDRIGQMKLGLTLPLEFEVVNEELSNTDRGDGGFGSTGK